MTYLTVEQLLFVHMRVLAETGGSPGIRDLGLLAAAVARPQASFDGDDLYPDVFSKTAALLDSLVRNHPFVDGNKRVAITAAGLFLRRNGWRLTAGNLELEEFMLAAARSAYTIEEIRRWLHSHATPADA